MQSRCLPKLTELNLSGLHLSDTTLALIRDVTPCDCDSLAAQRRTMIGEVLLRAARCSAVLSGRDAFSARNWGRSGLLLLPQSVSGTLRLAWARGGMRDLSPSGVIGGCCDYGPVECGL